MKRLSVLFSALVAVLPALSSAVASLKDLTLEDASSAFGTLEAEIRLTEVTPSPAVITLEAVNADVQVPTTVTVPAGRDRVAFEVSFASPRTSPDADLGCVIATFDGVKKFYDVELPNADDTLTLYASLNVGTTLLKWNEPGKNTSLVYDVLRTVNGVQTTIASGVVGCSYVDASTPSGPVSYKVVARSGSQRSFGVSSQITATSAPASVALTLTLPQSVIVAPFRLAATASSGTLLQAILILDGTCIAEADPENSAAEVTFVLDPEQLSNGTHTIKVVAETDEGWISSSVAQIQTASPISNLQFTELLEPNLTGPFLLSCDLQAVGQWTVSILDINDVQVRAYTGFGSKLSVLWDGKDENGDSVSEGLYRARIVPPSSQTLDTTPSDIPFSIVYSSPRTLGLLTRTGGNFGPDYLYAKFVVQLTWDQLGWSPYCILLRRDHMKNKNTRIGPRAQCAIRRWLGSTVQRFWADGHGKRYDDADIRHFRFGSKIYSSKSWAETPGAESIEQIIEDSGRDTSETPFKFVMIDSCWSAGGLIGGGVAPIGHVSLTPDNGSQGFPRAFRMNPITASSDNCFIGINGLSGTNNQFGWLNFRQDFWIKFASYVQPYQITFGGPPWPHLNPATYLYFLFDISPFDSNGSNLNKRWRVLGGAANNASSY